MQMRVRNGLAGVLALAMVLLASAEMAEEKAKKAAKAGPPDEKAMMEAMTKAATPGEPHKQLETMIGAWDTKVTMWMDPSKPPEESTGTSENHWVLGNRYVQQTFEGTFMGQPFSGIGYTGYDNITKKYTGTWMDTGSTGTMNDPVTGKVCKLTSKVTVADNDHHTMEMRGPDPSGKVYKMMEITYVRKK